MDTLFGLPAHALLIHAPIVLLPIMALLTVGVVFVPSWRERFGLAVGAGVFVVLAMLFLAKESGEAFDEALGGAVDASRHEQLANQTFVLTIVWFVVLGALVGYERGVRRGRQSTTAPAGVAMGLAAVASLLAVLATIWLIRTGHEGSTLVWGPSVDQLFPD